MVDTHHAPWRLCPVSMRITLQMMTPQPPMTKRILGPTQLTRWLSLSLAALMALFVFATPIEAEAKGKRARKVWQVYRVKTGDTVKKVARRLGVKSRDLRRWNRLKKRKIKGGQRLKFKGVRVSAESVGRPHSGKLIHGINLDPDGDNQGLGWSINTTRNTIWGTPETVRAIKTCGRYYRSFFPIGKTPSIPIGSISKRDGGPIGKHKSHQSGRDVDVGFVRKKAPPPGHFINTTPAQLDLYKQWVVTKCFLDNPETKMIIIERSLVRALRRYIKRIYKTRPAKLKKYLAFFPRKKGRAVILADSDHKSHMHVRFHCPKNDRRCIP